MGEIGFQTALSTLESLEERMRRVEWHLSGSDEAEETLQQVIAQGKDQTVQARLARLERNLEKMASAFPVVHELLQLSTKYPDLFHPVATGVPTTLSSSELLAIVDSCATSFSSTASRLDALKDLPIPSAESSASLIALHPRLAKVEILQNSQAQEMAELREKTASIIQRWYELGVLGESECWTEWESRITKAEIRGRREEMHRDQEKKEAEVYKS